MKRFACIASVVAVIVAAAAATVSASGASKEVLERGKFLVEYGGCHDCHTPKNFGPKGPEPDMKRALSGHPAGTKLPPIDPKALVPGNWMLAAGDFTAYVGPWGVSYAMNLTPDEQTGIGLWQEGNFVKAMRTGKHMGEGRPILPPMPLQAVNMLSDDDLKAVFAYLKSLPPIKNVVPQPVAPGDVGKM